MKYRSDIDGMRCLAVVSVILFHLNKKIVPGGYTGVDIFFVISGFLITRIIADGLRDGDFSMSRFYARRVRRIFPALFTVLLSSTLLVVAKIPEVKSKSLNNTLDVIGLGLVFTGFAFLDSAMVFPGVHAPLPVLCTVLILYSGQSGTGFLFKILSWRIFVAIGVISYSLYLWHWPLIVFVKTITASEITFSTGCGIFLASLLMATISYYVVERPLRYGPVAAMAYSPPGNSQHFKQAVP